MNVSEENMTLKSSNIDNLHTKYISSVSTEAVSARASQVHKLLYKNIAHKRLYSKVLKNRDEQFCSEKPKPIEIPSEWKNRCPEKSVVTVMQIGRLGNQIWEYVSLLVLANITGREPFVPSCILQTLSAVFKNITTLPLKYIEHCPFHYHYLIDYQEIEKIDGDIVLPFYVQLPQFVIPHLEEVRNVLQFHDHLTKKSQEILVRISKGLRDVVFVGVHVRRTDYAVYMTAFYIKALATADYFLRQMNYFRNKYSRVIFVVVGDDPDWCERELSADDTVVVKGKSREQDLSLLASCNHSILDYGTFGTWGALLAGGETVLYNLNNGLEQKLADMMPNWRRAT
ncbi:hypothetical protein L9F63_013650 [Diploptera punctata]|uniref:L-Fucosyltransferase n=1 Tax=Diploptera punctata TaxID=6984 RepID=A0AAD8A9S3_DIPPU|nr:hypothetical protein L9F63_013650 [Diploptera punctata]